MNIKRQVYIKHPKPGYAVNISNKYLKDSGLERIETKSLECEGRDDKPVDPQVRYSKDNGRTWTDWQKKQEVVSYHDDYIVVGVHPEQSENFKASNFIRDPDTGYYISINLRQTIVLQPKQRYYNHCFWSISKDGGKTWSKQKLLKYEEGADFNVNDPINPDFLKNNSCYPGNLIEHSNGTIIFTGTSINIPKEAPDTDPKGIYGNWWTPSHSRDIGSALFTGAFSLDKDTYVWKRSNCVWVPMSVSCRGLDEGFSVELKDNRILTVWRGSNTNKTPGRKWFSISENNGKTLTPVKELKYDDGTRFYSPASIHGFIRHSITGKLFWVANITPKAPTGNSPRYPLVIAEIDENIPAVKRHSVTVIADREENYSKDIQWSNFSLLENRETHEIELYMTPIGMKAEHSKNPTKFWEADCYKVTVKV